MNKPNILYLFTDQQSASMMGCAGNPYLKTPNMDYIAEHGMRFTRAYTTNPVCSPARVSLMTGRYPSDFKDEKGNVSRENMGCMKIPSIEEHQSATTLGSLMKDSGYELYFGGKEHLPQPLRPIHQGFDKYCDDERELLATKTAELIKKPHNQPWLTVVSLINPHDICYMAIRDYHQKRNEYPPMIKKAKKEIIQLDKALKVPENIEKEEFIREHCPPLRENESPQEKESHAIQHLVSLRPFKQNARDFYTESDWRLHRWAYCRLTEVVDQEIGIILTALRESGQEENTLVMLSSDHGDMDGAHKLEHKTAFYEESANVPFVAMLRGQIAEGKVDKTHLISNGLDFLPTVCDYVGVDKGTSDSRGRSLRPLFEETNVEWRKTIGIESELGWSVVNEKGLKYNRYDVKGFEQELFDLKNDTGEMKPITEEKEFSKDLAALQEDMEKNWFPYSKVKG